MSELWVGNGRGAEEGMEEHGHRRRQALLASVWRAGVNWRSCVNSPSLCLTLRLCSLHPNGPEGACLDDGRGRCELPDRVRVNLPSKLVLRRHPSHSLARVSLPCKLVRQRQVGPPQSFACPSRRPGYPGLATGYAFHRYPSHHRPSRYPSRSCTNVRGRGIAGSWQLNHIRVSDVGATAGTKIRVTNV